MKKSEFLQVILLGFFTGFMFFASLEVIVPVGCHPKDEVYQTTTINKLWVIGNNYFAGTDMGKISLTEDEYARAVVGDKLIMADIECKSPLLKRDVELGKDWILP